MNRTKRAVAIILLLLFFIVLHNPLVYALANIETLFRRDNRPALYEETYKTRIETLEKELADYKKATGTLSIYDPASYVLSKIALRNIYDMYDYLIVNTSAKVNEGAVVLNEFGLVGTISEANKTTAKVSLLTALSKTSVRIGENYGILGEYDRKTKEFVVKNIDNYKIVNEGEEVVTSGFQEIPANLKIGRVIAVDTKGIETIVHVKPYVDFDNLNYMLVEVK